MLNNKDAERAVLAGICRYHSNAYFDVADLINENSFSVNSHSVLFKCLKHIIEYDNNARIDIASIYAAANTLNLGQFFKDKNEVKYLQAVMSFPIEQSSIRPLAIKVFKLRLARELYQELEVARDKILEITGDETVSKILSVAEDAVFNFNTQLNRNNEGPTTLGSNIDDYVKYLEEGEGKVLGVSTGYSWYDTAIGGGLRRGTVNVIGARPKVGKTLLSDNIGLHIAGELNIPVLNLDTEMTKQDHQNRCLAILSKETIEDIELGKHNRVKIRKAAAKLKKMPYHYESVGGKTFEEQLSIIRRWIVKSVGLNDDGTAKQCVVIYDYIKLMDSEGISAHLQEYQALGFLVTGLHNFALKYAIPFLSFVQLNRDGINKESTDAASGSDRIIWLCSNFSIFKKKSDDEIAQDGPHNGNRKLVTVVARHGAGLDDGDYICMHMKGKYGLIEQGLTRFEIANGLHKPQDSGFVIDNDKTPPEQSGDSETGSEPEHPI